MNSIQNASVILPLVQSNRNALIEASVRRFQRPLLAYLRTITDYHEAKDVLQELWIKALRFTEKQLADLPYFKRIAYNLVIDRYRRNQTYLRACQRFADETEVAGPESAGEAVFSEEEERRLRDRFWERYPNIRLSERQKDLIFLHARYGWTFAEIEEKTGTPAATVCDWVGRARKAIARTRDE